MEEEEEVALELASQQVIKYLLSEPDFLEKWQSEVSMSLRKRENDENDDGVDLWKPSTSSNHPNPAVFSVQSTVSELTSTIHHVVETFKANVDHRNCYISEKSQQSRDASSLFEAGLKVERLLSLDMSDRTQRDQNGMLIGAACRRISQVVKSFGKRFQSQPSVEIRSLLPVIHRLCRLFYTVSHEIHRFSESFRSSKDRKLLGTIGKSLENSANSFNLNVLAEIEMIGKHLDTGEKRKSHLTPKAPTMKSSTDLIAPVTRRQKTLATSIQEVIGRRAAVASSDDVKSKKAQFHSPGGIATSIISKRKGYLMDDNLMKGRQRIAHVQLKKRVNCHVVTPQPDLNIDKNYNFSPLNDNDIIIMKSARKITEMVLEDMKQSMQF